MKISTEVLLGHARISLANAGGDVHDNHHADWLLQESIAYSLIAIAQELMRFNDLELQKLAPPDEIKVKKVDKDLGW